MSHYIGREIAGYRVIEPIGIGGMSHVFLAYQSSFDRYVALKTLPEHFAEDQTYLARFKQEAKIIARLEHKHILPVYDFGEDRGITYLAMRYLRAGTLKDVLVKAPSGRLVLSDAARLVWQIANALDYAHTQKIVHRDVKPSNILVDTNGDAYLMDFGIAKVLASVTGFTASGSTVGTPAYMSPEQGAGRPVDGRSDIYSLGVILYQLLAGRVPYEADTPLAVLLAREREPLLPPSSFNHAIPAEFERIILKALEKSPDDRYPTAGLLADDLAEAANMPGDQMLATTSAELLGLITKLADDKPSEEITQDIRSEASATDKRRGRVALSPLLIGLAALVVILVISFLVLRGQNAARPPATETTLVAAVPPAVAPSAAFTLTPLPLTSTPTEIPPYTTGKTLFQNDFSASDLTSFQLSGTGTLWSVGPDETGNATLRVDNTHGDRAYAQFGSPTWKDYLLEFKVKIVGTVSDINIANALTASASGDGGAERFWDLQEVRTILRYDPARLPPKCQGYQFGVTSTIQYAIFARFTRVPNGSCNTQLAVGATDYYIKGGATYQLKTWYDVRVAAYGSTFTIYRDGILIQRKQDSTSSGLYEPILTGLPMLIISPGVLVYFDDIRVTELLPRP